MLINKHRLMASLLLATIGRARAKLWIVSDADNDVFKLLSTRSDVSRTTDPDSALEAAGTGDGLLIMADGYPWTHTPTPAHLMETARSKQLKLYLEFFAELPGFDRARHPTRCATISASGTVTSNVSTSVRSLCACTGVDALPSVVKFTGEACGTDKQQILWTAVENLTPCPDCKGKQCNWSATTEPPAWRTAWTGRCGVPPTNLPQLPTRLCGSGPAPPLPVLPPQITKASWKLRGVVTTSAAASHGLEADTILLPQGAYTSGWCEEGCAAPSSPGCVIACNRTLLALAKVAGVYKAVYGAPKPIQQPILFGLQLEESGQTMALVATTKLSNMISGRFGPVAGWHAFWSFLVSTLQGSTMVLPAWIPTVRPAYNRTDRLHVDGALNAIATSARWLVNGSNLLSDGSDPIGGKTVCCKPKSGGGSSNLCEYHNCTNAEVCPKGASRSLPTALTNISCIQEGWSSILHWNGSQNRMATFIRTDGNAESSMGLAAAAVLVGDKLCSIFASKQKKMACEMETQLWLQKSTQLADYQWRWSDSQAYLEDPEDGRYGIVWWNQQTCGPFAKWAAVDYGDNAANVLIGASVVRALAETGSWDLQLLRSLFAEARTTGQLGFRPSAISSAALSGVGTWRSYWQSNVTCRGGPGGSQPHYGGYLSAFFLWAGSATGLHGLLTAKAVAYCVAMMEGYFAGEWEWNESMSNEQARFLLPLSWLVRVADTPIHRGWLVKMATDLLASQDNFTGAIKQEFGIGKEARRCGPCAPATNEEYGSGEGPLMHDGSEPIADSLYTLSFALVGLREAVGATNDERLRDAEGKLVDFLVRTQVVSTSHPELNGAWFRAFDYKRWDFWASDNDWGYGPWTTETGWSNGWIMTAIAAREANTTVWDVMSARSFDPRTVHLICTEMMIGLENLCSI